MKKHPTPSHAEKPARNGIADAVPSIGGGIIVRYRGPTNSRGSRWIATLERGEGCKFRASASFDYGNTGNDGADAAALACLAKFTAWANEHCKENPQYLPEISGRVRLGSDGFAYIFNA